MRNFREPSLSCRRVRSLMVFGAGALLASIGFVSAGVEGCIGGESCEEPCPIVLCDTDADCPESEICVVSTTQCCASSSCFCDPNTGEWACTGDCIVGVQICVSSDPGNPNYPFCVPASSEVGVAVLAVLMAVALTVATIRKRRVG